MTSDIRHALRVLRTHPVFTIVACLSLAIGIGANTAIFSVANTLLLRPLPGIGGYDRTVEIGRTRDGRGFDTFSYPDFLDVRRDATPLEQVAGWQFHQMSLAEGGAGQPVLAMSVSANYFDAMGVRPGLGRIFLPEDDVATGAPRSVILSHAFWQRHMGGSAAALGSTVVLNRKPYTVIGVAPQAFRGHIIGVAPDVWIPLLQSEEVTDHLDLLTARGDMWLAVVGRMRPGATVATADASVRTIFRRLAEQYPETNGRRGARVIPLGPVPGAGRGPVTGFLTVLMVMVGLVLAVTCTNVSGMLLARSSAREKEIAVRLALGASRWRVVRYLLIESMLLFGIGGTLGILIAIWSTTAIDLSSLPVPITVSLDVTPDLTVLGVALLVTFVTGVVFGVTPALQTTRPDLAATLKSESGVPSRSRYWLRRAFVAGQVGIAFLLLIAAGLFLRSLQRAGTINAGFDPTGVYMTTLDLSREGYETREQGIAMFHQILDRIRSVPGVQFTTLATDLPLDGGSHGTIVVPEGQDPTDEDNWVAIDFNSVAPDYFQTLDIPLLRGRVFDMTDQANSPGVAVVSRTFANQVWPGEETLGRQIVFGSRDGPLLTIIGVVEDTKNQMLTDTPRPFVYTLLDQSYVSGVIVLARMTGDIATAAPALRGAVLSADERLSLTPVLSVAQYTGIGIMPQRLAASITTGLGVVAILLAGIGVYGVVAFTVTQRTREIGIRMALGAHRRQVLGLILRSTLGFTAPGVGVGLILAVVLGRLLQSFLLGINPLDAASYAVVSALMATAIMTASFAPATRASRVDPMLALRRE